MGRPEDVKHHAPDSDKPPAHTAPISPINPTKKAQIMRIRYVLFALFLCALALMLTGAEGEDSDCNQQEEPPTPAPEPEAPPEGDPVVAQAGGYSNPGDGSAISCECTHPEDWGGYATTCAANPSSCPWDTWDYGNPNCGTVYFNGQYVPIKCCRHYPVYGSTSNWNWENPYCWSDGLNSTAEGDLNCPIDIDGDGEPEGALCSEESEDPECDGYNLPALSVIDYGQDGVSVAWRVGSELLLLGHVEQGSMNAEFTGVPVPWLGGGGAFFPQWTAKGDVSVDVETSSITITLPGAEVARIASSVFDVDLSNLEIDDQSVTCSVDPEGRQPAPTCLSCP